MNSTISSDTTPESDKSLLNEELFATKAPSELKRKSVRGGIVVVVSQGLKFGLQTGSMMVLARMLSPADFGLQGMVVALTGVLGLFRDVGLGIATVQRKVITHEQISTLFWVNAGMGVALTLLGVVGAPALAILYKEPRVFWVTVISALAFSINGLGIQHTALLQRGMRFVTIAKIEILSLALSSALAIGMAWRGYGYWSLVALALSGVVISSAGAWVAVPWRPGLPSKGSGVRSMLHLGGTVTINSLVVYLAYNAEKVLLGRFWGAEALGLYGRAYQLINLPIQQLNSSFYAVAFPALTQIQNEHERLCRSFLRGYTVLLSLSISIAASCAVFAEEIVRIVLGPKWSEAAPILRLLMPMVLGFAMVNPFGWFLLATGRAVRSLRIAFMIAPVVILAVLLGLSRGPQGVALWYSLAVVLLVVPIIAWSIHGTGITGRIYWQTVRQPLLSGALAGAVALGCKLFLAGRLSAIPMLIVGMLVFFGTYALLLLVVMGHRTIYADLWQQIYRRTRGDETESVGSE